MTKITTDFSGLENATTRLARMQDIHDFWLNAGSFAAAGFLNAAQANLNGLLDVEIAEGELFGTWLAKLNLMNEPDKWLSDTLSGAGPNAFILADDTARIFGPDGVTPVSVPGTAVSLAVDDWEGLELGSEMNPDAGFDSAAGWTLGTGWSVTGGRAQVSAGGVNTDLFRAIAGVVVGRAYLVEVTDLDHITGAIRVVFGGAGVGADYTADTPATRRIVVATSTDGLRLRSVSAGTEGSAAAVSVREVLNWPAYQNNIAPRPTWGRAPAQVRNRITASEDFTSASWSKLTGATAPTARQVSFSADAISRVTQIASIASAPNLTLSVRFDPSEAGKTVRLGVWATGLDGTTSGNSGDKVIPAGGVVTHSWTGITNLTGVGILNGSAGTAQVVSLATEGGVQLDLAAAPTAYQRRGPIPTDITEAGVRSFGVLRFDLTDDAVVHQIHAGGTIAIGVHGRGGSYLIPSVVLAPNDVLSIGPISVLDNGVVVAGCPVGILRACTIVPWDTFGNLVGYSIMKANPNAKERARAMRFFAAYGARGWLVEGANIVADSGFDDAPGWTLSFGTVSGSKAQFTAAGSASVVRSALPGAIVPNQPFLAEITVDSISGGTIGCGFSGGTATISTISTPGVHRTVLLPNSGNTGTGVYAGGSTVAVVDNFTLRPLTPEF
jgi:hypothetical protein